MGAEIHDARREARGRFAASVAPEEQVGAVRRRRPRAQRAARQLRRWRGGRCRGHVLQRRARRRRHPLRRHGAEPGSRAAASSSGCSWTRASTTRRPRPTSTPCTPGASSSSCTSPPSARDNARALLDGAVGAPSRPPGERRRLAEPGSCVESGRSVRRAEVRRARRALARGCAGTSWRIAVADEGAVAPLSPSPPTPRAASQRRVEARASRRSAAASIRMVDEAQASVVPRAVAAVRSRPAEQPGPGLDCAPA